MARGTYAAEKKTRPPATQYTIWNILYVICIKNYVATDIRLFPWIYFSILFVPKSANKTISSELLFLKRYFSRFKCKHMSAYLCVSLSDSFEWKTCCKTIDELICLISTYLIIENKQTCQSTKSFVMNKYTVCQHIAVRTIERVRTCDGNTNAHTIQFQFPSIVGVSHTEGICASKDL